MTRIEQFNAAGVLLSTARSSQGKGVDPVVREFPSQAVGTPDDPRKSQTR
jgi:hypothetical protein